MYALCPTSVDFGKKWDELEHSVLRIMRLESIKPRQWDYNFSDIYALCVAVPDPYPDKLYDSVKKCLEMHVDGLYDALAKSTPDNLLNDYYRLWTVFFSGTQYLHNLFGYLNKHHISGGFNLDDDYTSLESEKKLEIGSLALHIWHEKLIKPNQQRIVDEILTAILNDRKGQQTQSVDVVHGVIQSFVQVEEFGKEKTKPTSRIELSFNDLNRAPEVQVYHTVFETKFLDATTEYYAQVASELLSRLKISEYMERVIRLIDEEDGRSRRYLHTASYTTVRKLCTELMVDKHKDRLNAVCAEMVNNEQATDLRNMYQLMRVLPGGLNTMLKEFEAYVKKTGLEAIASLTGDNVPAQFVQNVLKVHTKFTKMVSDVFSDDGDFVGALDKALQAVVNDKDGAKTSRASERLSRYIDSLLRKTKTSVLETDLDSMLSNTIIIFRYIEDKDVFQKFYSKMLSSRLILSASQSMDSEESMIAKLKQACGYEFTSKLSRMFTDVGLSRDLTERFHKDLESKGTKLDMHMNILVLQAGAWPLQAPSAFNNNNEANTSQARSSNQNQVPVVSIPPEFQTCVDHFEKFYSVSHTGRKLTWLYHMASVEVKLTYLDKPYTITMSIQQLSILNCFASTDSMSVGRIAEITGISGDLLVKTLRTIIDTGILSVSSKDDLQTETPVTLNQNMSNKRLKFKLPAPQMQKQVEKESEQVNNTVQQDRKYYMECTIVRIMKTRKVLKHTQLVNEVIEQTKARFTPDVNFIKKNIEALIEKMYIQRTDQNDEYQYLA